MIYKRKPIDYSSFKNLIYCLLICLFISLMTERSLAMSAEEMSELRNEVKRMFYHGYDNYVQHAYLYDELMPLSCRGRNRDTEPNRGDIDDILGNFSLTLIDAMDTLVVMNNLTEFQRSVDSVIKNVQFDSDIVVSVFETNIRVLGGLLSGHVLANLIKAKHPDYLQHYDGELLKLAKDCATRLLPAFNTSTGIPYPRVNLRHGMDSNKIQNVKDTCTACAGTMVLEFGALSRLTNDTVFEQKARKAMDYLWRQRHRSSDLVGSVLNIHNGDWIRRESGVGAGIDSYYEYLLKAYILFGDESYLRRFNRHYEGIMKYVSQGPLLVDVHMHKPRLNAKSFMDSLLAFWPGLQVLKGDLIPAIETHEILHQVSKMHNYLLPEAFNINDFQPYWAQFLIRPEFIESTYFLYEATKDEHYLEVGKQLINSIKKFTMTPCGFAAVRDVRTGLLDDRMDSFVLSETFKYLYLLFTNKEDLIIDLNQFVFTTEAHFLPLSLSSVADKARFANGTLSSLHDHHPVASEESLASASKLRVCPNLNNLFKEQLERESFLFFKNRSNRASKQPPINYYEQVRKGLANYVELSNYEKMKYSTFSVQNFRDSGESGDTHANREHQEQLLDELDLNTPIRLEPQDFTTSNPEHIKILKSMGINIIQMSEKDPVQLVHLMSQADDVEAGKEGIIFIKKMIQMSKKQTLSFNNYVSFVKFRLPAGLQLEVQLPACSAQFGIQLNKDEQLKFSAQATVFTPLHACNRTQQSGSVDGKFAILERGECMFVNKVRLVESMGAIGVIIIDNVADSSALSNPLFEMLGDQTNDVKIPVVLLYRKEADLLLDALKLDRSLILHITNIVDETEQNSMVKLVNSLKDARTAINRQLNSKEPGQTEQNQPEQCQATGEQTNFQVNGEPTSEQVKSNENLLNLDKLKADLQKLQDLVRNMVGILNGGRLDDAMRKLIEEYSKLKEIALKRQHLLPNLVEQLPSLQDFLDTMQKRIQIGSFDLPDGKPINDLFKQYGVQLPDWVVGELTNDRPAATFKAKAKRCVNLSSDASKFRAYFASTYWTCTVG